MVFRLTGDDTQIYLTKDTNHYTHRDTASLAALLDQAIPDLHDDTDIIEAEIIEETA